MAIGTYNVTTIIIIIKTLKKLFYKYECVIRNPKRGRYFLRCGNEILYKKHKSNLNKIYLHK